MVANQVWGHWTNSPYFLLTRQVRSLLKYTCREVFSFSAWRTSPKTKLLALEGFRGVDFAPNEDWFISFKAHLKYLSNCTWHTRVEKKLLRWCTIKDSGWRRQYLVWANQLHLLFGIISSVFRPFESILLSPSQILFDFSWVEVYFFKLQLPISIKTL